jgi:hypothetical protein
MWCDVCQKRGHTTETCWWDEQATTTDQPQGGWPHQWHEEEDVEEEGAPTNVKPWHQKPKGSKKGKGKGGGKGGKKDKKGKKY